VDSQKRTIWIADAHCDDGKRFIVRAEEKLTAFLELEAGICAIYHSSSAFLFCGDIDKQRLPHYGG